MDSMSTAFFANPYIDQPDQSMESIPTQLVSQLLTATDKYLCLVESRIPHPSEDASVYTGASGIALLYLHLHRFFPERNFLNMAAQLANSCLPYRNGRISFMCGDAGPYAISIVANFLLGNPVQDLIKRLTSMRFDLMDHPDEILYGRAGYLYALLFIDQYFSHPDIQATIPKVIDAIFASGRRTAAEEGRHGMLYYYWHNSAYVGAAHGFAGIIHTLLLCLNYLNPDQLSELRTTSEYVLGLRYKSGNYRSSADSTSDRLVQWCHGAPAVSHFLLKAHEVFGDERYMRAAIECSDITWTRGLLRKGYGICHGAAGNAYTFLALWKHNRDPQQLYRAVKFAEWCITDDPHRRTRRPDRPYSLFEGLAGTIYFLADISQPNSAKFPAYEIPHVLSNAEMSRGKPK